MEMGSMGETKTWLWWLEIRGYGERPPKVGFPINIKSWRCNLGHGIDAPLIQGLLITSRTFLELPSILHEPPKSWLGRNIQV